METLTFDQRPNLEEDAHHRAAAAMLLARPLRLAILPLVVGLLMQIVAHRLAIALSAATH